MKISGRFSNLKLWAKVHDSVLRTLRVHNGPDEQRHGSIVSERVRIQTFGLTPMLAEALDNALAGDADCECIHHDDSTFDFDAGELSVGGSVIFVGGSEIESRGFTWFEDLVIATDESPVIVVLSDSECDLVERVLRSGATECLLEGEVKAGAIREVIRDAICQKGLEKEVDSFAADKSGPPVNDRLTGLMSSEMAFEFFETEFLSSERGDHDVSCLVVRIEGIEEIGLELGTAFANAVLREIGGTLKRLVRHADVLSRISEAEFLVVLPGAKAAQAAKRGRQILKSLQDRRIMVFDQSVSLCVHVGVASRKGTAATRPQEILEYAREAISYCDDGEYSVSVWPTR